MSIILSKPNLLSLSWEKEGYTASASAENKLTFFYFDTRKGRDNCLRQAKHETWSLKHGTNILLLVITLLTMSGCYSCRGVMSIPPEAKSLSVQYFQNNAPLAPPTLSPVFTEALRDYIGAQTRLTQVNKGGDLQFEGQITGYTTAPVAIQSNDQAALNRLTITVSVKYTNKFDEEKNFESTFSRFADYPSSQALSSVEADLIREINRQLVDDIFNRAFNNW